MRLWGAIPVIASVAGALTISSVACAESAADKVIDQIKQDAKDRQNDRDEGDHARDYKHFVIIYQENHSFDNLYGFWGNVGGDSINGQSDADPSHTAQVRQDNQTAYKCLLQNDVNLTSPSPLPTTCTDSTGTSFQSAFKNRPFAIEDFIASTDTTCPKPVGAFAANGFAKGTGLPGGCTKDIVHRFYNEQYQINGGKQNRYVTGSDAAGLAMGYYDTRKLPI